MICFKGKVSKEARSFARKKVNWVMFPFNITMFIIGIILIIVGCYFRLFSLLGVGIPLVLVSIMWPLLSIFSIESIAAPQKVEIEDGFIECYFVDVRSQMKSVDKVKRVTDRGDFYEIDFYFPTKMICICQKDLLVDGTIEEFEKMFEKVLVKH